MFQNGVCVCVISLALTAVCWSDDTPETKGTQGTKKQRVSPKLLREAMALPEYKAQAPATATPPSMEHLQKLSEKLKSDGDHENADLLRHFIHEHQRLVKQSSLTPTVSGDVLDIRCEVIDVNIDELAKESILHDLDLASKTKEMRVELDRLVVAKKAKVLIEPMSMTTRFDEAARCHSGGEFPIPTPGGGSALNVEFREFGTIIEVLPTSIAKGRIRLQFTCEISEKDMENSIVLNGTTIPGISKRKLQSTADVNPGETTLHSYLPGSKGHRLFLMTMVTPKK